MKELSEISIQSITPEQLGDLSQLGTTRIHEHCAIIRTLMKKLCAFDFINQNFSKAIFKKVYELLLIEGISKHSLSHQMRTATTAVRILDFIGIRDHETIIATFLAAYNHDIGYRYKKPVTGEIDSNLGDAKKQQFKKHAFYGAQELGGIIDYLYYLLDNGELEPEWIDVLKYKDENGEWKLFDRYKLVKLVTQAVMYHNDYGTSSESYDPGTMAKTTLAVQFGDKIDNSYHRMYPEHTHLKSLMEKKANGEQYPYFTSAYCITNYELVFDSESNQMILIYEVNPDRMRDKARQDLEMEAELETQDPELAHDLMEYNFTAFMRDFDGSYGRRTMKVATEAMGRILDKPVKPLRLVFRHSESREILAEKFYEMPKRQAS